MTIIKKAMSVLLTCCLALAFLPVLTQPAYAAGGDSPVKPEGYVPPQYEAEHINLNGYYSVADDGQIMAELEWTRPVENPLRPGEGMADPGRPYTFKMWQSKKHENGAWSNWETRSPVDTDKRDGQVRVLNVAPNAASMEYLKKWMATPAIDFDGSQTTVGKGIIQVTPVLISDYNANPDKYLKTNPDTGELTNEYQYSVIMFGTFDANASQDLTAASRDATERFHNAGGGLMFGHDTLTSYSGVGARTYFSLFANPTHLNITTRDEGTTHLSTYVKVVDTGFLTSRPWNLEGKTLNIPQTHMLGQKLGGSYSSGASKPRVWMQFSNSAGTPLGTAITPGQDIATDNYYLATNGSIAMIQTGHTSGGATEDEAKVFANTLVYLAQSTTTTTARDASFIDEAKPVAPNKTGIGNLAIPEDVDATTYGATFEMSGSSDKGTDYAYRIQGVPQISLENPDMFYEEVWSTTETDPNSDEVFKMTALSGLKGYYVNVSSNPNSEALPAAAKNNDHFVAAATASEKAEYEVNNLTIGQNYYAHIYAVDYAGNVSSDSIVPVRVTTQKLNYHYNDGSDADQVVARTLLTDENKAASWPSDPTREGYRFDGWYKTPDCSGEALTQETAVFTDADKDQEKGEAHLYAKWVKTWNVIVSQRGKGTIEVTSDSGTNPFDVGSNIDVAWKPAEGYHVQSVWVDDVMITDFTPGKTTITDIQSDRYVVVEFAKDDEETTPPTEHIKITTSLSGGGAASSITPTKALVKNSAETNNYKVEWNAAQGYKVSAIKVDGINRPDLLGGNSLSFSKIERDHSVEVVIDRDGTSSTNHMVTTQLVGGPATLTGSGDVEAGAPHEVEATVSDTRNYEVESVVILDAAGNDVTNQYKDHLVIAGDKSSASLTLDAVNADLNVIVTVKPKAQAGTVAIGEDEITKINTSRTGKGTISPSSIVKKGDQYTVNWEAEEGWSLQSLTVDGINIYYPEAQADQEEDTTIQTYSEHSPLPVNAQIKSKGLYPFEDIQANHDVHATFVKDEQHLPEWPDDGWFEDPTDPSDPDDPSDPSDPGDDKPTLPTDPSDINKDTDGDGVPDTNIDIDGDGKPDVNIDTDGDGKPDINIVDHDGPDGTPDGKPDGINPNDPDFNPDDPKNKPNINIDNDDDLKPDVNTDLDGDGVPDVNIDTDGDGVPDKNIDANENGIIDDEEKPEGPKPGSPEDPYFTPDPNPSGKYFAVITNVQGDAPVTITASNTRVEGLSDYPIAWTIPAGYQLTGVKINGVDRPDLLNAGRVTLEDIDRNYVVALRVEKERTAVPSITKQAVNTTRTDANLIGDEIAYTITATNTRMLTTWKDAVIEDQVPAGLDVNPNTMTVQIDKGAIKTLPANSYDKNTHTLKASIGDLEGGQTAVVTFKATLNQAAITPEGCSIANIARTTDNEENIYASDPASPNDDKQTQPSDDPVGTVTKAVKNMSRPLGSVYVGDTLQYTIKVQNDKYGSVWTGVRITDVIPEGLTVKTDSLVLHKPDGTETPISADVYQTESRTLGVFVGDIFDGQAYELTFEVVVDESAVGKDIGNMAVANGGKHVPDGLPGHWGDDKEYTVIPGGATLSQVVADEAQEFEISTGKVYASELGVFEQEGTDKPGAVKDATAKTGDMAGLTIAGIIILAGGACLALGLTRKRMRKEQ